MASAPTYLICVGATKSGTSWLYEHLVGHPECHLRSVKELHYFDLPESGLPRMTARSTAAEITRLTERLLGTWPEQTTQTLRRRIADLAAWNAVLEGASGDLDAYRTYLTEGRGTRRVVADVTPSYALLPVAALRQLGEVAADVRILYLMRDPVARLWSHVRMMAQREAKLGQDVAALAAARMDRALSGDDIHFGGRGDYRGCLERLRMVFQPGRLMTMFTEDLMTAAGLGRLWAWLGIGAGPADFAKRVHEGVPVPLSPDHQDRARAALRDQYDYVAQAFPTLPSAWSANMIGSVA